MSTAAIVALVVVIIVVAAIVAAVTLMRGTGLGGAGLKHRFGPEYERALAHHDGDEKATRDELAQRVKRYGRMELRPLSAQDAERFEERWAAVKTQFVDDPRGAVAEADRLIGQLAERRGFPGPETPEHNDALSVHHPHELQGYRRAHASAGRTDPHGPKDTEELRQALVAAREMFDALTGGTRAPAPGAASAPESTATSAAASTDTAATDPASDRTRKTPFGGSRKDDPAGAGDEDTRALGTASGGSAREGSAQDPDDRHDGERRRSPLGHRFAALSGSGPRKDGTEDNR
ncbi:hypothetical protein [Actinacidiphila acidipaludis]|uniref:Secreted protein n=1 Tax=Actinacidiphila acidipaludis TaxID=2873382 RepID=A0ABS7QIM7_9ACTN|nr:hypothetical protein [Streptomyces acidipaludis]MBY8883029.1 hypothetical protein [Streptomyces acidipaludis]